MIRGSALRVDSIVGFVYIGVYSIVRFISLVSLVISKESNKNEQGIRP